MASCGIISGIHTNLKAIEKLPISSPGLFRGSFGLEPIQRICIAPKRLAFSESTIVPKASSAAAVEDGSSQETAVPTPKVIIDLDSNPDATVVEVTFGDRLGALVDTMSALKNLGLNVVKANVCLDSSGKHTTLCITNASTGRKVDDPEQLEAIRLTIINNMIEFHPESSALLAMGEVFGAYQPNEKGSLGVTGKVAAMSPGVYRFEPWKQTLAEMQDRAIYNRPLWFGSSPDLAHSGSLLDVDIATHIHVYDDGPDRSLLYVEAADRPGLIVDLVKIITEINIDVESGEFDTEGLLAKAKFHVSYKNKALIKPLQQVLANSLRYYLRRPTTEESSF